MKKTIQSHRINNKISQDKWAEIYNPGDSFYVNPYDYDNVDDYLDALREEWKEDLDGAGDFETYVDVSEYDDYDLYEAEIAMYMDRQSWYRDEFDEPDINPCDYEEEDDYLDALRKVLKEKYDPYNKCEALDPLEFDLAIEYQQKVEEKIDWKEKYDPDNDFVTDPCEYASEYEYLNELREEWKKKYDPEGIFYTVDPSDYIDVNEYVKAIEGTQDWMDEYDSEKDY